jgi:hypothetical protein
MWGCGSLLADFDIEKRYLSIEEGGGVYWEFRASLFMLQFIFVFDFAYIISYRVAEKSHDVCKIEGALIATKCAYHLLFE